MARNKKISVIFVTVITFWSIMIFGNKSIAGELFEIRYPNQLYSDPVFIADKLGFFEKQGIRVNFTGVLSGADTAASVSNGSNDFGGIHASQIVQAIANGFKVKAVAAGWASTKGNPVNAYIVKKDSPYKSLKDLAGKRVSGTPGSYTWYEALDQAGLKLDDIPLVYVPFDQVEPQLLNNQVVASSVLNPFLGKALKTGNFRILFDPTDIVGEEKGWPQQFVNTDFIEKHPDIVGGFVTAMAEACDWLRANPEEGGKIFAEVFGAPVEYAPFYVSAYPEHGLIDEKNAQLYIDLAEKYGDVPVGKLKTSDIYTNEFNPYFKK
jgi:ABC-type nitrate/sulfonate/bicarbonate transport system substrate-binding protein